MTGENNLALYQLLFQETLFILPDKNPVIQEAIQLSAEDRALGDIAPGNKYAITGQNKKGLVIAFSEKEQEFIKLPQNDFLVKILTAIKFNPKDVGYVNIPAGQKISLFDLGKETNLQYLVIFGIGLLDISADSKVSLYKPASVGNIPLLIAEPLPEIELDINKKKWLWEGLKTIFLK